jgi:hypothetical protein
MTFEYGIAHRDLLMVSGVLKRHWYITLNGKIPSSATRYAAKSVAIREAQRRQFAQDGREKSIPNYGARS